MRRRDAGNASVEYIGITVMLMAPLAYAILAFGQYESAVYGIEGAAQMASRAYLNSSTDASGRYAAARSAAIAGRNHRLLITSEQVHIECGAAECLVPGRRAKVTVQTTAHISVMPFARDIPLQSEHWFTVDPFREVTA